MQRKWLWTPLILTGLAAGSYGLFYFLQPPELPDGFLYGNGHVEGTEIRVSAEVSGRIVESRLEEGRQVESGSLLARIDDTDLKTRLAQAEAELAALESERAALQPRLRTWRHHLQTAGSELERYRKLAKAGTISPQQLDKATNAYEEARGQVQALASQDEMTGNRIEAARHQLELIRLQLDKTMIRSPVAGTVLVKAVEVGELVVPGTVIAVLVDMRQLEMKIYIPERDIGKVRLGAEARIQVDAFPDRQFSAHVVRVDQRAQFTPRDIHMPEERVRMVFGILLAVDNPEGYLKPGMPADAWLRVKDELPWPTRLVVPR